MFNTGEVVWVFSFCLEPISINSVILSVIKFVGDQPFVNI